MAERWEDWFEQGERLIWEGAPEGRWTLNPWLLFLAAFGVPFLAAGLFVSGGALLFGDPFDFGFAGILGRFVAFCFGLPFLASGIGMVFGPLYMQSQAPRHVRYALSDRRAYIATSWWTRQIEILTIPPGSPIEVEGGRSIFFQTLVGRDSDGDRITTRKGFENIADAAVVYRLLRGIQARKDPSRPTVTEPDPGE